ncbi:NlpC/P60 family protein [Kitasatospora sp. NPDC057223]|uniref:C40 family peptidase n=1 Tax=Kitasatospora sp. NPDC057223 TaxID=3346055 RepID=UPI0036451627
MARRDRIGEDPASHTEELPGREGTPMGGALRRTETTGVRPWVRAALRCGAVLAVAALSLPLVSQAAFAAPAPVPTASAAPTVAPGDDPLADAKATLGPLLERLHVLYGNAEAATEQYNGTVARLAQQQATVQDVQGSVDRQQKAVDAGTDVAAQLAAAQYRNGSASAYAELLLSEDPYEAVTIAELLAEASRSQSAFLDHLKADRATLTVLQKLAEDALKDSQSLVVQQDAAKAAVAAELNSVEQLVASLTGAQRTELAQLEKVQADEAQLAFLASGALGQGERTPSQAGRTAVAWALAQLGKPYVWGGAGPDVFDCSGLTSQAWLHAGKPIPRTSQEQWAQLQHVPLNQMRPGDLVIYFAGATHVAMYIGGGLVVQAPRPGAVIKVSPIGSMPILGAVRADPETASDESGGAWKVPDLPAGWDSVTPIAPSLPGTVPALPAPAGVPEPGTPTAVPGGAPTAPTSPTDPGSASGTASGTATASPSGSPTGTPSGSPSGTGTPSGTGSPSETGSPSATGSPDGSGTPSSPSTSSPDSAQSPSPAGTSAGAGSTAGSTTSSAVSASSSGLG